MSTEINELLDSYYANLYDTTGIKAAWNTNKTTGSSAQELQSFMSGIKDLANDLGKSVKTLLEGAGSIFQQMKATSSNTDILSLTTDAKKLNGTNSASYDIAIKQLAKGQTNAGAALNAKDNAISKGGLKAGENTFSLDVNGKSFDIKVNVTDKDTIESVQKKLATAVNNSKSGVTASVTNNSISGESTLSLTSKAGISNAFTLTDKTGNAVDKLGLNSNITNAQNAAYTVNGGEMQYSESNTVTIADGVNATLKKATDNGDTVKINVGKDTEGVASAVTSLVDSYNALMKEANILKEAGNSSLARQLSGVASTYAASLTKAGINIDKDGYLSIDKKKLDAAVESGDVQKALGYRSDGSSSMGFVSKLEQLSSTVSRNPNNLLSATDKATLKNSEKSPYDPSAQMYSSQYLNFSDYNKINQWQGIGTLFDTMF